MGSRNIANKVKSSKLAWLRKRLEDLEPEQAAHAVRPLLQNYRHSLDQVTAAWLPFVSEFMGPNDEHHDKLWVSLATTEEQKCLSVSYGIMQNWANHRRFRQQSPPTNRAGAQAEDSELHRTRGARQASFKQSLPGPDSGGRSTGNLTATNHEHAPADVRVRGTGGQQPLEALQIYPPSGQIL